MTDEEREQRGGFVKAVRTIVKWVVVVIVAAGVGFGTGYFLKLKEVWEREGFSAEQMAKMQGQIDSLERQVLEAEKSQLERALARAKLRAGLNEMLGFLTEAMSEVDQKNFGRAMQKIEAAKGAMSEAPKTPDAVRKAISARLDEIKQELERFDINAREKIKALAQDLEKGQFSAKASN
jgi:hypothetical protein